MKLKQIFLKVFFAFSAIAIAANAFSQITPSTVEAQDNSDQVAASDSGQLQQRAIDVIHVYFFYSKTCPHCTAEKPFLAFLAEEYPQVSVVAFEIGNKEAAQIYQKIGQEAGFQTGSVPLTIISNKVVVGYGNHDTHGVPLQQKIEACINGEPCSDPVADILSQEEIERGKEAFSDIYKEEKSSIQELKHEYGNGEPSDIDNTKSNGFASDVATYFTVPFFGSVDAKEFSLPVLSIVIGFLDGFNPCAMWTLLFLISLLLGMEDKRRMWILGITFILTSGFVYFLFMTAWLNVFLFLGMVSWVRIGIGLLAVGVGGYHIYEYLRYGDTCHVTSNEKRQKTFQRIKDIVKQQSIFLALIGIILLAFAVNLVELMCSAGFPAIFTQVLSLSDLPMWQYYMYMLVYLVMFMIDDIVVFGVAMLTLQSKIVGQQYAKYSKVVGGILMLLIGGLLLFKPELLMFG